MVQDPHVSFFVWAMDRGSLLRVNCDPGVVGARARIPGGSIRLSLVAGDLVGLTPARAALKVANHITAALRALVMSQERPEAPAPPEGATGAALQVPGQLTLF